MIRLRHLPADSLGLSALARDALSGRFALRGFTLPRNIESIARVERFDALERAALVVNLSTHLVPHEPHVAVLDSLRALEKPDACAVLTGQQPGFLASPLYSLYKALQAVRLARDLSAAWSVPVVPMFWNHADDHDIAEVHHAHLLNPNLDLRKVALPGFSSGKQPLSSIRLDEREHDLSAIRELLAQLDKDEPFLERALDVFMPRTGETFSGAFTRTLLELLGPLGLIVLEPDWIRASMSEALARIVTLDPARHIESGTAAVRALNQEVAIPPDGAALVYHHDRSGPRGPSAPQRRALRAGGDGFRYDGEAGSRTATELAAEIVQSPLDWSPGALLRPIVQDLCLPVAAYVGGFGELGYHAQLIDLRRAVGAPTPAFVPRVSCTLVSPECRHSLAKLELGVADVLKAKGSLSLDPSGGDEPAVVTSLRAIADRAAKDLVALEPQIAELDRALAVPLKRTAEQLRGVVEKFAEKAERVHQNRSGKGKRHERRLNNSLYPRGLPQERVLGPFQFVASFGEEWIPELLNELNPLGSEHLVVELGPDLPGEAST
jgi:bacillithiol biosynthesis cysteine-adding enzyme BshC